MTLHEATFKIPSLKRTNLFLFLLSLAFCLLRGINILDFCFFSSAVRRSSIISSVCVPLNARKQQCMFSLLCQFCLESETGGQRKCQKKVGKTKSSDDPDILT